ncbi:MAG TPA: MarR family winged helix-turn-helix transcriptional regulator [Stellaceae bacterium]|nr:MarR family winged helix-turn-helix transcriptional regulator [Stellaceae bacterium]
MTEAIMHSVGFLMNRILSALNDDIDQDLVRLGANSRSARVLVSVLHQSPLRCRILAHLVGLEATALSHLLRSLSRQGLITRSRVENDNRAVEVSLTAKGRRLATACEAVRRAREDALLKDLGSDEQKQLLSALSKLQQQIARPRRESRSPGPRDAARLRRPSTARRPAAQRAAPSPK